MRHRRFFWKLFFAQACAIGVTLALGLWLLDDDAVGREEKSRQPLWAIPLLALVASALLTPMLIRQYNAPLRRIISAARRIARGELSTKVPLGGTHEAEMLARSMNRMRDRLARHLETIDRQRLTLELVVSQLHEGVIAADSNGRIFVINPAAVRLLGAVSKRSDASFDGMPVEQCVLDHELQQLLLARAATNQSEFQGDDDQQSKAAPPSPIEEMNVHIEVGGVAVHLLARASDIILPGFPLPDANAKDSLRRGRLLVLTDVTELAKTMQVKADFAANASHELRTPLSAIRMAVETLKSMDLANDVAPAGHFLDVIARHSRRLEAMVQDLLDLSRVESSGVRFEKSDIDLPIALDELRAMFAVALDDKSLRWEVDIAPDVGVLVASPVLVRLILSNLIDNAIKFTPEGGFVRVVSRATEQGLVLSVVDSGCGIAPEEQARVFERFYQVHRARSGPQRGTGLGLSIVRHAVTAMRGEVTIESRLGEGTAVIVTIPQTERTSRSLSTTSAEGQST